MQKLIDEIKKTSGDMARRGWAESKGGNISLRLNERNYPCFNDFQPKSEMVKLPIGMPEIAGERFLVTGTGRFLRNYRGIPRKEHWCDRDQCHRRNLPAALGLRTHWVANFGASVAFVVALPDQGKIEQSVVRFHSHPSK